MKSILITGCSSGFGLETAKYFLEQGWRVIATMRTLDDNVMPPAPNLQLLKLDVTDQSSIAQAVAAAGDIDVLVNNAGIGWLNALEGTPIDICSCSLSSAAVLEFVADFCSNYVIADGPSCSNYLPPCSH